MLNTLEKCSVASRRISHTPAFFYVSVFTQERQKQVPTETHARMFIVALFIVAPN